MNKTQLDSSVQKNLPNFLIYSLGGGGLGILLYASKASPAQFFSLCSVAMMIAGSSLGAGALLGFLFGIPMSVQPVTLPSQPPTNTSGENSSTPENQAEVMSVARRYRGNTNLEDISNWLTKMLLGVGLTQIPAILDAIKNYAEFASPGLGGEPSGKIFATSILVYFLICGFIFGYMWARLNLARMFTEADNSLEQKVAKKEQQISDLLRSYISLLFVPAISGRAAPCVLKPYDKENAWITIVEQQDKIVAMYRNYGKGVVLAFGHEFVLNPEYEVEVAKTIINGIFNEILNPDISHKKVLVSTGHGEILTVGQGTAYHLNYLAKTIGSIGYILEDMGTGIV
jgi:hypothetical protein